MALNQREKVLLTVPVLLGGFMGFYNWVHEPLSLRRSEATVKAQQVDVELTKDQAKLAREGDLAARTSTVAAEEKLIDAWVPGKNAAALFIWHLSQAEIHSGVQINGIVVGEKKLVSEADQPKEAEGQAQANQGQPAPAQKVQTAAYEVTVVRLDLKVKGQYAEHLLFNQSVEQMPLFLNTHALKLQRAEAVKMTDVSKYLGEGKIDMASMLLGASPEVAGTYTLNLYFKTDKAGPATSDMAFAQGTGRIDPFAMDSVDLFLRSLQDYFGSGGTVLPSRGGGRVDPNGTPTTGPSQMG